MALRKLSVTLLLAAVFAAGCDSFLSVEDNPNAPDQEQALSNPEDVETLIGGSFFQWWSNWQLFNPMMGLTNAASSFRSGSFLWAMDRLGRQPREPWITSASSRISGFNASPWNGMYSAISSVNDGLVAIEQNGLQIGSEESSRTARARAFAKFVQGISHANLGVMFDQAFVVTEDNADLSQSELELKPYPEVMSAAFGMIDEAIQIAEENSFSLADGWINGNPMSSAEFARFMRSMKARKMAQAARTPEERANVDWQQVIQLVDNGIQESFFVEGDGLGGNVWGMFNMKILAQNDGWGRASYYLVGPADNSGSFQDWLATPPNERNRFVIETEDRRIVGPDSATAPGKDYYYDPGYQSYYNFKRYNEGDIDLLGDDVGDYSGPNLIGPLAFMQKAEMDMLKAEALLRTGGDKERVAELINKTRVQRGELSPATSANPVGSWENQPNAASDASLWAMVKYEKQIETYATAAGVHFFDDRGWQDLVEGTPLHFPLPAGELNILDMDVYTFGGDGEWAAAAGWE